MVYIYLVASYIIKLMCGLLLTKRNITSIIYQFIISRTKHLNTYAFINLWVLLSYLVNLLVIVFFFGDVF